MKLMTTIEATTLCATLAVTDTFVKADGANARQISDVPFCVFARTTSAQLSTPPRHTVTMVFDPPK